MLTSLHINSLLGTLVFHILSLPSFWLMSAGCTFLSLLLLCYFPLPHRSVDNAPTVRDRASRKRAEWLNNENAPYGATHPSKYRSSTLNVFFWHSNRGSVKFALGTLSLVKFTDSQVPYQALAIFTEGPRDGTSRYACILHRAYHPPDNADPCYWTISGSGT